MNKKIVFENVHVKFNDKSALENITFTINHPTFLSIMGPNGAGKTTLLKLILGLIRPNKGRIKVFGIEPYKNPSKIRKLIGYVPQKEHISREVPIKVRDVVLMGLLMHKRFPRIPTKRDIKAAAEALRIVNMEWAWNHQFNNLSGGQQQRVLIARGLATNPKILLLDEPFTGIDVPTQTLITDFLHHIKNKDITIIIVTHDINPVSGISDRIMLLNKRVIAFDKPNNVLNIEILREVYGDNIKIFEGHPCPIVITGDTHG